MSRSGTQPFTNPIADTKVKINKQQFIRNRYQAIPPQSRTVFPTSFYRRKIHYLTIREISSDIIFLAHMLLTVYPVSHMKNFPIFDLTIFVIRL